VPDLIEPLVAFTRDLAYDDIPEAVVQRQKLHILDLAASAVAALDADGVPELARLARGWGGSPESSVVGEDLRVPIPLATLVNTTMARSLELDNVHEKALLHPTVAVVPLALAIAEARGGVSGRDFLAAVIAVEEVTCRIGLAPTYHVAGEHHKPRGWSYTYQCGTLGASLGAARMLGLDRAKTLDAVGNAYTAVAGNQQCIQEGTLAIRVQQGVSAQSAAQAALMAEAGITGPHQVLEGMFGWLTFWQGGSYDRDVVTDGLGERWEVTGISVKPYPCCKITHNAINATISTMAREGLRHTDVEKLVIHVNSRESWDEVVQPVAKRRVPQTPMEAQFAMPFVVAVAAVNGGITLGDVHGEGLRNRTVLDFAQRVEPVVDPDADVSQGRVLPMPTTIDLHTKDGGVVSGRSDYPPGHPNDPLPWQAVLDKLHACAGWPAGPVDKQKVDEIAETIRTLEHVDDVGHLARLLGAVRA
jgi:2-methylcitrate dehydratase PrpD